MIAGLKIWWDFSLENENRARGIIKLLSPALPKDFAAFRQ
jgi:hypothetical protein